MYEDLEAKKIASALVGKLCIRIDKHRRRISDPMLILGADANPWAGSYHVTVDLRSPDGKPPKKSGISRDRVVVRGIDADYESLLNGKLCSPNEKPKETEEVEFLKWILKSIQTVRYGRITEGTAQQIIGQVEERVKWRLGKLKEKT